MTIWSHEDPVPGIFNDGAFPVDRPVLVRQTMGELVIEDKSTGELLARWPLGTLRPVPDAGYPNTLRLRQREGEGGRLAILDRAFNEGLTEWWPGLRRRLVFDRSVLRTASRVSLAAFLGLGLFFLALLPVLGQMAAYLVSPRLERQAAHVFLRHGDPLLERIEVARTCDTQIVSPILDKLIEPLRVASGWPESIRIRVIDDALPNAASIPGGKIVIFDGLLEFARNGDEVAGILAHEIGHLAERHGMRNLFVTSLNFFGFDQLLGNFSGQLVVHPVGGLLLTRREGRHAEYEADRSAIRMLNKAGFPVRPLADFLDRIAYLQGEREVARGWLSTHPLSQTRSRMIRDAAPEDGRPPVLTAAEFSQLRAVCATQMPERTVPPPAATFNDGNNERPHYQKNGARPQERAPDPDAADEGEDRGEEGQADVTAPEDQGRKKPDLGEWDTGG